MSGQGHNRGLRPVDARCSDAGQCPDLTAFLMVAEKGSITYRKVSNPKLIGFDFLPMG